MAFVDEVAIKAQAGKGGDGVIRWLHIKGTEKGGPSGGDGGRGGDIVVRGVRDLAALARYRFEKDFKAESGGGGDSDHRSGGNGTPLVLSVPVGTSVRVATGAEYDIETEGQEVIVFKGGMGGRGNAHFKGSTNQNPFTATPGKPGEGGDIIFVLKIIADVGLVGLPNAGKSSLLNALTNAKSKVGEYPFTTLEPNLGALYGAVLADIPGLIEGASAGRGLGTKFLKHVEKTKFLLHLVSAEQDDPVEVYREVRKELESFGRGLADKPELILLSKIDLVEAGDAETKREALATATGKEVVPLSIKEPAALKRVSDRLSKLLAAS